MKTCTVHGCDRKYFGRGYCERHYHRIIRRGILDFSLGKIHPERGICSVPDCGLPHCAKGFCQKHYMKAKSRGLLGQYHQCSVNDCDFPVYSMNLCRNHYELNRRTGKPIYVKNLALIKCKVPGCANKVSVHGKSTGYCRLHLNRIHKGIQIDRSYGIRGKNNPNWNGGVSEYPNHYEMKKMRKRVLEEENYTCHYCGKYTKQVHHKDLSRNNHRRENLTACCNSCNQKMRKSQTSKYKRLYGYTLKELRAMSFFKNQIIKIEAQVIEERLAAGF